MDRYYLGKFVEEINEGVRKLLTAALGEHLAWWVALDRDVDVGENHYKVLRYLYVIGEECPISRMLSLHQVMDTFCKRNSGADARVAFHFGHDNPPLPEGDDLLVMLRFYLLDEEADHLTNRIRTLAVVDDPDRLEALLPRWLNLDAPVHRSVVADEVMAFSQNYLSSDCARLSGLRDFEAAFWRVVNLACAWLEVDTYEDIVALMPARFAPQVTDVPDQWENLRRLEHSFSQEAFVRCSRASFRFCQLLTELRR